MAESQVPETTVVEHVVYVDTRDRNMRLYPNPFHFVVEFGSSVNSPNLNVPVMMRDAYYIRFRTIILPLRLVSFQYDRYFILRMKELDIPQRYHTNPNLNMTTDVILYNAGTNGPNLYLECRTDVRFPTGHATRLQKLTFEFLDSKGSPLVANSNASNPSGESWDLVYSHLLKPDDDTSGLSPEVDPSQMLNNVMIEMHIGALSR